jgi:hypothetical protein
VLFLRYQGSIPLRAGDLSLRLSTQSGRGLTLHSIQWILSVFLLEENGWGLEFSVHVHLMLTLRIYGVIPPLPSASS